jgi:hypothetical protein
MKQAPPLAGKDIIIYRQLFTERQTVELGNSVTYSDGSYCVFFPQPYLVENNVKKYESEFCIFARISLNTSTTLDSSLVLVSQKETVIHVKSSTIEYQEKSVFERYSDKWAETFGSSSPDQNIEDIQFLAEISGFPVNNLAKFVLADKLASTVNITALEKWVFFSFLYQHFPVNLPEELLPDSQENWNTFFGGLVEETSKGIVLIPAEKQTEILTNAREKSLFPSMGDTEFAIALANISSEFNDLRSFYTRNKSFLIGNISVNDLFDAANTSLNEAYLQEINSLFFEKNTELTEFISEMNNRIATYGEENVEKIVTTFSLGRASLNHLPMVNYLNTQLADPEEGDATSVRELATYSRAKWITIIEDIIESQQAGYPENTPGELESEKIASYANVLFTNHEKLYPDVSYISQLKSSNEHGLTYFDDIHDFILDPENEFNLLTDVIEDKYTPAGDPEEQAQRVEEFYTLQRVFRMAPTAKVAAALFDEQIHCAGQLYFAGKKAVQEILSAREIDEEQSTQVFTIATLRYASALALHSNFNAAFNYGNPRAISSVLSKENVDLWKEEFPNLQTLFGTLDYCTCTHCQSILSPSAYLVDMLTFLQARVSEKDLNPGPGKESVKDVLFDRRPDIGYIALNCKNTETAMPYIDLVCEILENEVNPPVSEHQTTLSTVELCAAPEHINNDAYDVLRNAYFPMYNSFNLWQEQSRAGLEKAGIKRYELMELFRSNDGPDDAEIAAEYFGLTTLEKDMIIGTGKAMPGIQGACYDSLNDRNRVWRVNLVDDQLMSGADFLDFTGLTCQEMLELIQVKWIDLDLDECTACDCSCNNLILIINTEKFDKAHRFLRLWRKSGYKMWELDLILRNNLINPNNNLDSVFIDNFRRFKELQKIYRLTTESLLSFYGYINTEIRNVICKEELPLFNNLFLLPAIKNPIEVGLIPQSQNGSLTENYYGSAVELDIYKHILIGALLITENDYEFLKENITWGLYNSNIPDPITTTLETLSILYRYTVFAKSHKLSIPSLFKLCAVINDDPFITHSTPQNTWKSPVETLAFVEKYHRIKESGLTVDEWYYLLNYAYYSPIGEIKVALGEEDLIDKAIEDIRISLDNDFNKFNIYDDSNHLLMQRFLGRLSVFTDESDPSYQDPSTEMETALDLITRISHETSQSLTDEEINTRFNTFLSALFTDIDQAIASYKNLADDSARKDFILRFLLQYFCRQYLSEVKEIDTLMNLVDGIWGGNDDERKAFISETLGKLRGNSAYLHTILTEGYQGSIDDWSAVVRYKEIFSYLYLCSVNEKIVKYFQLDIETCNFLLETFSINGSLIYNHFLDNTFFQKSFGTYDMLVDFGNFSNIFRSFFLIHKLSILISKLGIIKNDLVWLKANSDEHIDGLDLEKFWLHTTDNLAPYVTFNQILRLTSLWKLKKLYPDLDEISMLGIIELSSISADPEDIDTILDDFASISSFDRDELESLVTNCSIYTNNSNNTLLFHYPETFDRIAACFKMIKLIGTKAATVCGWAIRDIEDKEGEIVVANGILNALKAKYSVEQWLEILKPLNKPIREGKCNALCLYLIENSQRYPVAGKNWTSKDALYAYFLVDVEMSACQLTSRIKLVLSSVQLFVQRCMMNLETNVKVEDHNVDWKQWKWMKYYRVWEANRKVFLYPENWIEPELRDDKSPFFLDLENDMNQGEISNDLVEDVFRKYLDKLNEVANLNIVGIYYENTQNLLHIISRTRTDPSTYFYRTYDGMTNVWSYWEKIDMDIKGEVVVPIVYNRKLHLFWLVITNKALPKEGTQDPPTKYMEIQLAWSHKINKGWTTPKISKKKHIRLFKLTPSNQFVLTTYYNDLSNELWFNLYERNEITSHLDPLNTEVIYSLSATFFFNEDVALVQSFNATVPHYNYSTWVVDAWGALVTPLMAIVTSDINGADKPITTSYASFNQFNQNNPLISISGSEFSSGNATAYIQQQNSISPLLSINSNFVSPQLVLSLQGDLWLMNSVVNAFKDFALFYRDSHKVFFVKPEWIHSLNAYNYELSQHYHPFVALFKRELDREGIDGLLTRKIQTNPEDYSGVNTPDLDSIYQLESIAKFKDNEAKETVDFNFGGAYSIYNWELFFHAPLYIACRLSQNQKFEDAMRWFHYIFNPTDTSNDTVPQKYWITKPFHELNQNDILHQNISYILNHIDQYANQVKAWLNNPFKPHLVARYRPVAYERAVVMKYIDNLISWGDQLFRRDTIESINEATLLYILAYEILGPRPEQIPSCEPIADFSYNTIAGTTPGVQVGPPILLPYQNAISYVYKINPDSVSMDGSSYKTFSDRKDTQTTSPLITETMVHGHKMGSMAFPYSSKSELPRIDSSHFCIPFNEQLLSYWDLVEDRLFKIRHCMNIEGMVRQLPLFEPPIDPALLVKAATAGLDISTVLDDLYTSQPFYRFRVILQKAIEFCNEVKSLGEKLLSVLEKKDAEELTLLRSSQEINMQLAIKQVRNLQISEATANIESQNKAIDITNEKLNYYSSREYMNALEGAAYGMNTASVSLLKTVAALKGVAAILSIIPEIRIGVPPAALSDIVDGKKLSSAIGYASSVMETVIGLLDKNAALISTQASYKRRKEDWDFQARLSKLELIQLNQQLLAAEIRKQISEKELENLEVQIEQLKSTDEYYRTKYTNQQLYNWMISQVSSLYFQAYKLAFDMAKRAEKCYRYELGIQQSSYISFGYWDSLKKGLLAGDKLMQDLHRLDAAYIEQNKRELELNKSISLAQIFPAKLLELITTGATLLDLPEWLFNMDYPGHYMRRIKSVSISIPNVAGPYTNVNCTLTLLKSSIRINSLLRNGDYVKDPNADDPRFIDQLGAIQSIATSHGQNDSGMFELNFNDERYLPFEGAGVISSWKIDLPAATNQFDLTSISDVIIHMNYTARDAGSALSTAGLEDLLEYNLPKAGMMLFSLKHDFPTEWNEFLSDSVDNSISFEIKRDYLPYFSRILNNYNLNADANTIVSAITLICISNKDHELDNPSNIISYNLNSLKVDGNEQLQTFPAPNIKSTIGEKFSFSYSFSISNGPDCLNSWDVVVVQNNGVIAEDLDDIILVVNFGN